MVLERLFLKAAAILAALAGLGAPALAQATGATGWTLCNRTSFIIEAAVGRPEGTGITVDGWIKLQPGTCKLALAGPLQPATHYLYGRSSAAHLNGHRQWRGATELCVDPISSFSLESPPDCTSMGLEARDFRPVEITSETSWSNAFTEVENYSVDEARNAGLQRLLDEAGVVSSPIDGRIGQRTRSAITEFLKQRSLPADTSDADLIDYLEQAADARGRSLGFTLCNRTRNRVWSAIARRSVDGWESRGWWQLEAGGCARVIDRPLRSAEHFVYAEMEDGTTVRTLTRASEAFCIGSSKFAIIGRDDCEVSQYRTALFAATPAPEDRKLVFEFFDRDFGRAPADAGK